MSYVSFLLPAYALSWDELIQGYNGIWDYIWLLCISMKMQKEISWQDVNKIKYPKYKKGKYSIHAVKQQTNIWWRTKMIIFFLEYCFCSYIFCNLCPSSKTIHVIDTYRLLTTNPLQWGTQGDTLLSWTSWHSHICFVRCWRGKISGLTRMRPLLGHCHDSVTCTSIYMCSYPFTLAAQCRLWRTYSALAASVEQAIYWKTHPMVDIICFICCL